MPLEAGKRFGPYEILAPLGAGGMGEVYKARDTRLDRTVAIKVLPSHIAAREDLRQRFEREARAVSSLNHPHICVLFDIGEHDGIGYMVMEHLEGETLLDRLKRGPLPMAQALKYAVEIADAVDRAHRGGIVHRDLKPGNIMLTRDGAKVLDFGLAKSNAKVAAADAATLTVPLTIEGTVVGTPQYMSPEQLEGKEADARSDIFAFGCVLYEMVSGKRAFEGKTRASVIAAILERDPPSLTGMAPPALDRALRRCLAKDPDDRWQSASDLRAEVAWIAEHGDPAPASGAGKQRRWLERAVWSAAVVLPLCLTLWLWPRPSPNEVVRFTVFPPAGTTFSSPRNITVPTPQFELSPDGRSLVFAASAPGAKPTLWLRPLAEVSARPIPGTEGAESPVWSPDGRWIAFFAEDKLKKVPFGGGPVQVIAESISDGRGVSWGPGDIILLSQGVGGLSRVSSSGGALASATSLDAASQERLHRWPQFLPDGRHFLFTTQSEVRERRGAYAGSLDDDTKKFVMRSVMRSSTSSTVYAPPGYLLFLNEDTLMAQRFDAERLSLLEQPLTVAEQVGRSTGGKTAVSASGTGVLAHANGMFRLGRLVWFDRAGNRLGSVPSPEGDYTDFRLSPDEKRLAVSLVDRKTGVPDLWLVDEARGGVSRFTLGQGITAGATWSPDGTQVAFRSDRGGAIELWRKGAAGAGAEAGALPANTQKSLGVAPSTVVASDWSAGHILFAAASPGSGSDLWLLPLSGESKPVKFLDSPSEQVHGNFSPDGKLVAYSSNESGKFEVHVQTYPRSDRQWQVSTNGGYEPRWRRDGQEIYYLSEDGKLMAVPVGAGPSFGVPRVLFQTRVPAGVHPFRTNYVPSADGNRFLVNTQSDQPPTPITVVLNWVAGLKR